MLDESTLGVPFITGLLVLVSLFIAWYRRADSLVSSLLTLYNPPDAHWILLA
jgi:hypothetical protein